MKEQHRIVPVTTGTAATITTRAARLLLDPRKAGSQDQRFISQARDRGWLSDSGFNGTIREINTTYPLRRLQIELSTKCNLRCSYCYSESGPANDSALTPGDVETLLNSADRMGVLEVDFTGGEFFIYRDWKNALKLARELGFVLSVHTNGTALSEANVESLKASSVSKVQVALDGFTGAVHDSIRGLNGAFNKTIRGIRLAVEAGLSVNVVCMVHKKNCSELGAGVETLRSLIGPRPKITFDRLIPTGGELVADLAFGPREFYETVAPHLPAGRLTPQCSASIERDVRSPICGVGSDYAYVTAAGEIALCPTMTSRDNLDFAGPNIRSMSIIDAWEHAPIFQRYRGFNCRNVARCAAGATCRGGCRSNAYFDTGDPICPDLVSCNLHKNESVAYVDYMSNQRNGHSFHVGDRRVIKIISNSGEA